MTQYSWIIRIHETGWRPLKGPLASSSSSWSSSSSSSLYLDLPSDFRVAYAANISEHFPTQPWEYTHKDQTTTLGTTSPTLCEQWVGSLTSHRVIYEQGLWEGPTVYRPYLREIDYVIIEQFSCSIECRKTKTKPFTWANHNRHKQHNEPIRTRMKTTGVTTLQARENSCEQVTIGFGFACDWLRKWREFTNQSQSVVKQNQSKRKFTFDSQGLVTSSHTLQLSRNTSCNQKLPSAMNVFLIFAGRSSLQHWWVVGIGHAR